MDFHIDNRVDTADQTDYLFELGKARSLSGNFLGATRLLEEVSNSYVQQKKYSKYMECLNLLLRIYKELQNVQKITILKEELMELVWEKNIEVTSRVHYTFGLCALYMGDLVSAREEFEKAINQGCLLEDKSIRENNEVQALKARIELCFARSGMTSFYVRENNIEKAQQELACVIQHLHSFKVLEKELGEGKRGNVSEGLLVKEVLKETAPIREKIELNAQLLKVTILRLQQRYCEVENLLWEWYERVQKSKDLYSIITFFYYLGQNYLDMQDYSQAGIFLNLAKKSIDYDNFRHLYVHVQNCLNKLNSIVSSDYDLIVNLSTNSILERHKGKIDFKNQFILLGLLKTFLSQPGVSHSKESLVEKVWKQKYDPRVHDNKLYVTIKRLREMMEPDTHHIRYIFCGKDGYYLNSKVRVLFKETPLLEEKVEQEAFL